MMKLKRRIPTFAVTLLLWGATAVAADVAQLDSTDRTARFNVTSKGKIVTATKAFNLVAAASEPGTLLLLGVGMAGVGVWGRKRWVRKRNSPR